MSEEKRTTPAEQQGDDARLSRLSGAGMGTGTGANADETVREYEARYRGASGDAAVGAGAGAFPFEKRKNRELPRSYSTLRVSDEEKQWAAVAHASVWITLLTAVFTFGFLTPLAIFAPLVIYFMFRRRSDYVAFHALQAFVLQLLGTVGAFLLFTVGGFVWMIGLVVAIALMALLIGFILVPVWGLVGIVLFLVSALLPLASLLFGTIGAIETYNGRDYRYPFIARWVDRQLAGSYLDVMV